MIWKENAAARKTPQLITGDESKHIVYIRHLSYFSAEQATSNNLFCYRPPCWLKLYRSLLSLSLSHFSFHFPDVHHADQDCPPPTCLQFPSIFTFLSLRLSPDFLYRFICIQQIFDNLTKSQEIFWNTIHRWEILVSMLFKLSFTWPDETLVLVSYYLILLTIWVICLKISWSLSFHKSFLFETNPTPTMSVWQSAMTRGQFWDISFFINPWSRINKCTWLSLSKTKIERPSFLFLSSWNPNKTCTQKTFSAVDWKLAVSTYSCLHFWSYTFTQQNVDIIKTQVSLPRLSVSSP